MSIFIKELLKNKIQQITSNELLQYSKNYGFQLTKDEAEEIIAYYQTNDIDPFNAEQRMKFFKQLAQITNKETAQKANRLFIQLIREYNLEHLF